MKSDQGRISARHHHQPDRLTDGATSEYTFGDPQKTKCTARRGSHAGLDQINVPVLRRGYKVAEINVHLHHNGRGLSVGSTLRVLYGPEGLSK